jgi:hypothetical protein
METPAADVFALIDASVRMTSILRGLTLYPGIVRIPPANADYEHLVNQMTKTRAALEAWIASAERDRDRTRRGPERRQSGERRDGTDRRKPSDTDAVA